MAKQRLRDLSYRQWVYVITPSIVGVGVAWTARAEEDRSLPFYLAGGGLGLTLLLAFLMVYGEDL